MTSEAPKKQSKGGKKKQPDNNVKQVRVRKPKAQPSRDEKLKLLAGEKTEIEALIHAYEDDKQKLASQLGEKTMALINEEIDMLKDELIDVNDSIGELNKQA